jgi:hypothetical protein
MAFLERIIIFKFEPTAKESFYCTFEHLKFPNGLHARQHRVVCHVSLHVPFIGSSYSERIVLLCIRTFEIPRYPLRSSTQGCPSRYPARDNHTVFLRPKRIILLYIRTFEITKWPPRSSTQGCSSRFPARDNHRVFLRPKRIVLLYIRTFEIPRWPLRSSAQGCPSHYPARDNHGVFLRAKESFSVHSNIRNYQMASTLVNTGLSVTLPWT